MKSRPEYKEKPRKLQDVAADRDLMNRETRELLTSKKGINKKTQKCQGVDRSIEKKDKSTYAC